LVLPVKMLNTKDHHLCNHYDQLDVIHQLHIPAGQGSPFILLVERGICTFVKQVRNAQHLGAAAVLIADTEHDHLPDSVAASSEIVNVLQNHPHTDDNNHSQHETAFRLADDGSGMDVSIPSLMIARKEYEEIKTIIDSKKNETGIVLAEFAWHVPKYNNKISMELWSSPRNTHTKQFLASNFSVIAKTMDLNEMHGRTHDNDSYDENMNLMRFRERPLLLDGDALGCVGRSAAPDEPCWRMCTNGGRYCHAPHIHTDGSDIVTEALRRLCIEKHYKSPKFYWDYIDHFSSYCWESDYFSNPKCIADAYKHSGIDHATIESCFEDSGDPKKDEHNALLQDAIDMARKRGIHKSPTVLLNHEVSKMISWQGLSPRTVLFDLCETFAYGDKPHVCYACMECGDPVACAKRSPMKCKAGDGVEKEDPNAHKASGSTAHKVFRWFFGLFLVGGCFGAYVFYQKKQEENFGSGGTYSLQDAFLSDSS